MNIGFIGCGQIGRILLCTLLKSGKDRNIFISTLTEKSRSEIKKRYPVIACSENKTVYENSEIVFLCVPPSSYESVLSEMEHLDLSGKLIIATSCDIPVEDHLKGDARIIKMLPNTAIECGCGIVMYSLIKNVTAEDVVTFKKILKHAGSFVEVDKSALNKAGKISLCGPSIIYTIIEATIDSGIYLGLSKDLARELALKTVMGTALKAEKTGRPIEDLKHESTPPAESGIESLKSLEKSGIRGIIMDAFSSAL